MANIKISEIAEIRKLESDFYFLGVDKTILNSYKNYSVSYNKLSTDIYDTTIVSANAYAYSEVYNLSSNLCNDIIEIVENTNDNIRRLDGNDNDIVNYIDNLSVSVNNISTEISNATSLSVANLCARIEEDHNFAIEVSTLLLTDYSFKFDSISSMSPTYTTPGMIKIGAELISTDDNYNFCGVQISVNSSLEDTLVAYVKVPKTTGGDWGILTDYNYVKLSAECGSFAILMLSANSGIIQDYYASCFNWYDVNGDEMGSVKDELCGLKHLATKATDEKLGLVKLGYTEENRNFALSVNDDGEAFVTVPAGDVNIDESTIKKVDDKLSVDTSNLAKADKDIYGTIKLGFTTNTDLRTFAVEKDENGKAFVKVPSSGSSTVEIDKRTIKNSDNGLYVDTAELQQAKKDSKGVIKLGYSTTDKKYALSADDNGNGFVELPIIGGDGSTITVDDDGKASITELWRKEFLKTVYPISSVYMTKDEKCDAEAINDMFGGTWSYLADLTQTLQNGVSAYVREL